MPPYRRLGPDRPADVPTPESWWAEPLCQMDRQVFRHVVSARQQVMRMSRFGTPDRNPICAPDVPPRVRTRKPL